MDSKVDFNMQYNTSYNTRYGQLGRLVLENPAVSEYGLAVKELKDDIREECIVVATLFLASGLKPSVLDETSIKDQVEIKTYVSSDAVFFIEDMNGKLEIRFADGFNKLTALMSGMVLGFVGLQNEKGVFECCDVIFPRPADRISADRGCDQKGFVLLISNCLLNRQNMERLQVVTDFCRAKTCSILVIGDLFTTDEDMPRCDLLNQWAANAGANVYIGPGFNDPTTRMLPQYPLHELLFSKGAVRCDALGKTCHAVSSQTGSIIPLTNPCQTTIAGFNFSIITHHIMEDMIKYVPQDKEGLQYSPTPYRMHVDGAAASSFEPEDYFREDVVLNILEQLIKIRHLVPNAPDTLSCVPYNNIDPFVINECDFLVVGGCSRSCKRRYRDKTLLGIPDFDKTGTALLLNLDDGEFEEIVGPDFTAS